MILFNVVFALRVSALLWSVGQWGWGRRGDCSSFFLVSAWSMQSFDCGGHGTDLLSLFSPPSFFLKNIFY